MSLDRAHGKTRDLGDLLVRHLLEVEQGDDYPVPVGQQSYVAMNPSPLLSVLVGGGGVLLTGLPGQPVQLLGGVLLAHQLLRIALEGDDPIHAEVVGDGVQPGGEARLPPEPPYRPPGSQEHLLGRLGRQVVIPQGPQTEVEHQALVPLHQLPKGLGIPVSGPPGQFFVGDRH